MGGKLYLGGNNHKDSKQNLAGNNQKYPNHNLGGNNQKYSKRNLGGNNQNIQTQNRMSSINISFIAHFNCKPNNQTASSKECTFWTATNKPTTQQSITI